MSTGDTACARATCAYDARAELTDAHSAIGATDPYASYASNASTNANAANNALYHRK